MKGDVSLAQPLTDAQIKLIKQQLDSFLMKFYPQLILGNSL